MDPERDKSERAEWLDYKTIHAFQVCVKDEMNVFLFCIEHFPWIVSENVTIAGILVSVKELTSPLLLVADVDFL